MSFLTHIRFKITVAQSTTVSNEQDLRGLEMVGLHCPAALDASATVTFFSRPGLAAGDPADDTPRAVKDSDGAALAISIGAQTYVVFTAIEKELVNGLAYATLVAVGAQSADRIFTAVCKPR